MQQELRDSLDRAADVLRQATAIVVGAGAGMGVDSGLPDFRGTEGFWRAYPPLRRLNLCFEESANPALFHERPRLAWGFYGHRIQLYRRTSPHGGFRVISSMALSLGIPLHVVTSNVDGQFQRAGYGEESVYEVHGSIHHLQCLTDCSRRVWENEAELRIDEETLEARDPLPTCPDCGSLARPNVLMFGDWAWNSSPSERQAQSFRSFMAERAGSQPVYLELGAGTGVPTIRHMGHRIVTAGGSIIRINPREPGIAPPDTGLALGAKEALLALAERLGL